MKTIRHCVSLGLMAALLTATSTMLAAADGKGNLKGKVIYGTEGVAKVSVTLEGAVKKSATTDDKGEFEFKDLPAGEYRLEARGIAKNTKRKGSAEATVSEKTDPVTIKLE